MKNIFCVFILFTFLIACQQTPQKYTSEINFETMGTFGTVKIVSDTIIDEVKIAKDIDSIFIDFNFSLSTYINNSLISKYNNSEIVFFDDYIKTVFESSLNIFKETEGAFNPKVKPLFDYWKNIEVPSKNDSLYIDSLVNEIQNFNILKDSINSINNVTSKEEKNDYFVYPKKVDFSAIAKGYGVDVIAYYLDSLGYTNYMVDIGGEVNCKGKNQDDNFWRLGIEEPNEATRAVFEIVELKNKSMATSGNYRNFKVLENGQKIVHIINPKTGYPEISNLLSASIIADNCMEADAYATACMVMGVDTCFQFVLDHPELECYLIYSDENGNLQTKFTEGFGSSIVK